MSGFDGECDLRGFGYSEKIGRILVIYHATRYPLRGCVSDHLYAFERSGEHEVVHLNTAVRSPGEIPRDIDLVVIHTTFLSVRWNPEQFDRLVDRWDSIAKVEAPVVALPQDEFINTDGLERALEVLGVEHVYSVADSDQWPVIYPRFSSSGFPITRILTGYLDETTVARADGIARDRGDRPRSIDVGYRAWKAEAWLGDHGRQKVEIARRFLAGVPEDVRSSISLEEADVLLEDEWIRFMLDSRWTIGVEGGASIIDRDGSLRRRTVSWEDRNPGASYEMVKAACFPDAEGTLNLRALSPRHLEACVTHTGQILIEGDYNGVLEPERHYIPLRADYSNLAEVVERMEDEATRKRMVERARQDIVDSGIYHSRAMVDLIASSAGPAHGRRSSDRGTGHDEADRRSWETVRRRQRLEMTARRIFQPGLRLQRWIRTRLG